jgi:Bacterial Ig-like domain
MNLTIAAKLGFPALALAAALVACPGPEADVTAPLISSVTPTGVTVAKSVGKISVTFNEAMDTTVTAGVIAFTAPATGAPAITAPAWSADKKTLSVTIPALTASSAYKFNVTALAKDVAGNKFAPGTAGYSFTTAADVVTGTAVNATAVSDGAIIKDIDGNPAAVPPVAGPIYQFYPLVTDGAAADSKISMRVGDVADDAVGRGALRFTLPAGVTSAQVLKAELILTQYKLEGVGAWARGLSAEGTDFAAGIADTNGPAASDAGVDFEAAAIGAASAAVTTEPAAGAKVTLDVTAYVKSLAAGKPIDLRLKFGGERTAATGANSGVRFYSADAPDAATHPVLKITK